MKHLGKAVAAGAIAVIMILSGLLVLFSVVPSADAAPSGALAGVSPASASAPAAPSAVTTSSPVGANPLPSGVSPPLAYHGPDFSHLPAAWGPADLPPGAPILPASSNSVSSVPYVHGVCVGKWPVGGQSSYSNGCIGHDEPAMNPFSNFPGSGGNVSWNVGLPVSAGPHLLQADDYIAVWFGMDLYDPFGYDTQCFLELQLYPDTNAAGGVQENAWSGFAVGWQIQLSNGYEDPCFAAPLLESNGTPLQMNGGDHLFVNMTGWVGSPYGEGILVDDATLGVSANMTLYNTTGNYPLDPAYSANNVEDSLPWSPGGDLPVAFSFESGHTIDDPENDTFGGCNSGAPPPTPLNPSTPCGSYNPKGWAEDTVLPWRIYSVTFFNAHSRQRAAQFGFEQDFGATAWIDGLSEGTCTGRDGSAYCSYPWYSYSASQGAFNFGATDYAGTTQDFGQYDEYDSLLTTDSGGLNFYPVQNFTYLDPHGVSLTIDVKGSGTVYFLNHAVSKTTTFSELPPGAYSLNAWTTSGKYFERYSAVGGISLDTTTSAFSSFTLSHDAILTAVFGSTAPMPVPVTIADKGNHGSTSVVQGFSFPLAGLDPPGTGLALLPVFSSHATTVASGGTLDLAPGIYSVLAEPNPGYNFTSWTTSSSGIYVFAPESNYTWINVSGTGGTLTAHYASSHLHTVIWLFADPAQGGRIEFNGKAYSNGAIFSVPVGSYPIAALPNAGYSFVTWGPGLMAAMTNFSASTTVVAQAGAIYLTVAFSSAPTVTNGGVHGSLTLNGVRVTSSAAFPQVGDETYVLAAAADPGYVFTEWTTSHAANASIADRTSPITTLELNSSVTIKPHFAAASASGALTLVANGGRIVFDTVDSVAGSTVLGSVGAGTYSLAAIPGAGYVFDGWTTSGGASVSTFYFYNVSTRADIENLAGTWSFYYVLTLSGSGTVAAHFSAAAHPVTFIDFPYNASATISVTATGLSRTVDAGHTTELPSGVYTVTYHGSLTSLEWFATGNLSVHSPTSRSTLVTVSGSGALYVVAEPAHSGPATPLASPGPLELEVGPVVSRDVRAY